MPTDSHRFTDACFASISLSLPQSEKGPAISPCPPGCASLSTLRFCGGASVVGLPSLNLAIPIATAPSISSSINDAAGLMPTTAPLSKTTVATFLLRERWTQWVRRIPHWLKALGYCGAKDPNAKACSTWPHFASVFVGSPTRPSQTFASEHFGRVVAHCAPQHLAPVLRLAAHLQLHRRDTCSLPDRIVTQIALRRQ